MVKLHTNLFLAGLGAFLQMAVSDAPAHATLYTPAADSYVQSTTPTTNYGSNSLVQAKAEASTLWRKAYLRFEISSFAAPLTELTNVNLHLNFINSGVGGGGNTPTYQFQVWGLKHTSSGQLWSEATLNWNNAPANNTTHRNQFTSNATLLGEFSFVGKTSIVNFSSPDLLNFLKTDTDHRVTLMISRVSYGDGSYSHAFASKEMVGGIPARLELLSVPEPSTLILLGFASIGFFWKLRRARSRQS